MDCSSIRNISNQRIYERNLPSSPLQQYTSFRAVPTKYSMMPIVDPQVDPSSITRVAIMPTYNLSNTFNPGNRSSPWSGYATNVEKESILRDQVFPITGCLTKKYNPSNNSDLYVNHMGIAGPDKGIKEFPNLFKTEEWCTFDPSRNLQQRYVFQSSTRSERNNNK